MIDPWVWLAVAALGAAAMAVSPWAAVVGAVGVAVVVWRRAASPRVVIACALLFVVQGARAVRAVEGARALHAAATAALTPPAVCTARAVVIESPVASVRVPGPGELGPVGSEHPGGHGAGHATDAAPSAPAATTAGGNGGDSAPEALVYTRAAVRVHEGACDGRPIPPGLVARLYDLPDDLRRGDELDVTAKILPVHLFEQAELASPWPGIARSGLVASGAAVDIERLSRPVSLAGAIDAARAFVRRRILATYAPGAAGFGRALVLGETDLPEDDIEAFRDSGLLHILAVSGTHLVLVVSALGGALRRLLVRAEPLSARVDVGRVAAAFGIAAAWLYSDFAGGSGSAVRAAAMLTAALLAKALGRRPSAGRALAVGLAVTALVDPLVALDVSFALSAGATCGLVLLGGPLSDRLVALVRLPAEDAPRDEEPTPDIDTPDIDTPNPNTHNPNTPTIDTPSINTHNLNTHNLHLNTHNINTHNLDTPHLNTPDPNTPTTDTPHLNAHSLNTPNPNAHSLNAHNLNTPNLNTPNLNTHNIDTPHFNTPQFDTRDTSPPRLDTPAARTRARVCARAARLARVALRHVLVSIGTTLAATIGSAPAMLRLSPRVPVLGVLANVVAAPLGELLALPVCLAHAVAAPFAPVERALGLVGSGALLAVRAVAVAASSVGGGVGVRPPTPMQLAAAAVTAAAIAAARDRRARRVALAAGAAALLVLEIGHTRAGAPAGLLRVTALDVGQGDSILIDFPDGRSMLIDGGGMVGNPVDPGTRVILPVLAARRRSRLDVLVLTHPHPDHFTGLATVAGALPFGELWETGQGEAHGARGAYAKLLGAARARGAPIRRPPDLCGKPRAFGEARVEVLHPCPRLDPDVPANDASLVLRVDYGKRSALLVGDAEREAEHAMIASGARLRADLLKVGHHGSRTSSSDDMLRAVSPAVAMISCGVRNRFGHPHPAATARLTAAGATILRTDHGGAIVWETDGDRVRLFRP